MFQFNMPNQQYILSLDTLDLCFLSQYLEKNNNEKSALWSKCADQEPAYYKIEIVSEELQDDDSFIEPDNSYMCYICNINVPLKFYKQHYKSKIHQNCKKLAEKFLENVTKQMSVDLDNTRNYVDKGEFYCETCCKVVASKYKRKHKISNQHLKSVEHDKVISKFLDMYINNNHDENHTKTETKYEIDLESNSESDTERPDECDEKERITNERTEQNNITCHPADNYHHTEKPRQGVTGPALPFCGKNSVESFQVDLKDVIKRNNLQFKLHTIEDNSIIIVVPKENKNLTPLHTFTGQQLEQQNVKEPSTAGEYDRNNSHSIDVNISQKMVWHNKSFTYQLGNKNGSNNSKYQQSTAAASDTNFVSDCESICSQLPKDSIKDETVSKEESFSTKSNCPRNEVFHNVETVEEKLIEYKKQFSTVNETELNCLVCAVRVQRYNKNIIEHVEGFNHTDITDTLLRKNYIEKKALSLYFCYLCHRNINDFLTHINSNITHKNELAKGTVNKRLLRKFVYEDPNNQNTIAIYCRAQYKSELKRNKIIAQKKSSFFKFFCQICFIYLSRVSEIDHMLGERHRCALEDQASVQ